MEVECRIHLKIKTYHLTRVRRIRGQVNTLERALESGSGLILAILQQIAAVLARLLI